MTVGWREMKGYMKISKEWEVAGHFYKPLGKAQGRGRV